MKYALPENLKNYNQILKITDSDLGYDEATNTKNPLVRLCAKGIVTNALGEVAIFNKVKLNEYHLIGGGIDENESYEDAFVRECEEEMGCDVKITECLGYTIEEKSQTNFVQITLMFAATVVNQHGNVKFSEKEIAEQDQVLWLNKTQAVQTLNDGVEKLFESEYVEGSNVFGSVYQKKFIAKRDAIILTNYVNKFKDKQI